MAFLRAFDSFAGAGADTGVGADAGLGAAGLGAVGFAIGAALGSISSKALKATSNLNLSGRNDLLKSSISLAVMFAFSMTLGSLI